MTADLFIPKKSGALFSKCRRFRYVLWRIWDQDKPKVMFIGLNPSTANETEPDPTITRVVNFASRWGYGGVYMLNCFPLVTEDPEYLEMYLYQNNPFYTESENFERLKHYGSISDKVIFAWGAFKIVKYREWDKKIIKLFPEAQALVINKDGSPRHPLYVNKNVKPIKFVRI